MKIDFLPVDKKIDNKPSETTTTTKTTNPFVLIVIVILVIGIGILTWQLIVRVLPPRPNQEQIPPPQPVPEFTLAHFRVSPTEAFVDESIRISFTLANDTQEKITNRAVLILKERIGEPVAVEALGLQQLHALAVTLQAGGSRHFYYDWSPVEAGYFRIIVLGQSIEVNIMPGIPREVSIKAFSVNTDKQNQIFINEPIEVIVVIENPLTESREKEVEVFIEDKIVYSFKVVVPAETTEIFFYEIPGIEKTANNLAITTGDHTVFVNVVEAPAPAPIPIPAPLPTPAPVLPPELDNLAIIQLREQLIMDTIERASPSFVAIEVKTTTGDVAGSGFIVSTDGLVLTNAHIALPFWRTVLEYRVSIDNDGQIKEFLAELVDSDPFQDLAVLQLKQPNPQQPLNLPFLTLGNSDLLRAGQTIIFIGNLLGRFPKSANQGMVAYLNRDVLVQADFGEIVRLNNTIQITADVNHGNSGGPLLNLTGEVVGMVTAKGGNGHGIGFALPSNALKQPLQEVKQHRRIIHPFLGIAYKALGPAFVRENNHQGFSVTEIVPNSPAHNIITINDIVIKINNHTINPIFSLGEVIRQFNPGDVIELTVLRDNREMVLPNIILREHK